MPQTKIVAVGAGSASFGLAILRDVYGCGDLDGSHLVLVDVDQARLDLMHRVAQRLQCAAGSKTQVSATADIAQALPDASYVIVSVAVARLEGWRLDWEVPLRYGIKQILAENAAIGGLFQLLRNLPPILQVARAMERACPDALLINFSNPVPRVVHAVSRYSDIRAVGLCHGLEIMRNLFARWLQLPAADIHLTAAGINHFTWILDARHRGTNQDLYSRIRDLCFSDEPPPDEPLCQALFRRFGYFPTCGDNHTGEFLPTRMVEEVHPFPQQPPDDWPEAYPESKHNRPYGWVGWPWRIDFEGSEESRARLRARLQRIASGEEDPSELLAGESGEYALRIILSIETDQDWLCPAVNVPNSCAGLFTAARRPAADETAPATPGKWRPCSHSASLIANLPPEGVVEVPAIVTGTGIHPVPMGEMPEGPAYFVAQQLLIQPLASKAAAEGDIDAALQALALEPAVSCIDAARAAFEDLLSLQHPWLPQFA